MTVYLSGVVKDKIVTDLKIYLHNEINLFLVVSLSLGPPRSRS